MDAASKNRAWWLMFRGVRFGASSHRGGSWYIGDVAGGLLFSRLSLASVAGAAVGFALLLGCGGKVRTLENGTVVAAGGVGASGPTGASELDAGSPDVGEDGTPDAAPSEPLERCEATETMRHATSKLYVGPCRTEQDEGFDGSIDSVWEYSYDSLGRLVATDSYDTRTGTSYQGTSSYDREGQLASQSSGPQDAGATWTNVFEYDSSGRFLYTITGTAEDPLFTYYVYDDDGRLIRLDETRREDGVIEAQVRFTYDSRGLRVRDTYENAVDGGWQASRILEHTYDDARREVLTTEDRVGTDGSPPDGLPDWSNRVDYDSYGNILVSATDENADGRVDACTVRYYGCW